MALRSLTVEDYVERRKAKYETFFWMMHLVPRNSKGSDLHQLPSELEKQLDDAGVPPGLPINRLREAHSRFDWAREEFGALLSRMPHRVRDRIISGTVLATAVNEAEFNGHVYKCENGYAIIVPFTTFLLTTFAAEMLGLLSSAGFKRNVVLGDKIFSGLQETLADTFRRTKRTLHASNDDLSSRRLRAACEMHILFKRYSDLGVSDMPDLLREQGPIPNFGSPERAGHVLEIGSHLRRLALRFLLLHECGHIALNHFDDSGDHNSRSQEFDADICAIKMALESTKSKYAAAASIVGAWFLLTVARRLEAFDKNRIPNTHPSADERLDALRSFVNSTDLLSRGARRLSLTSIDELQEIDLALNQASDRLGMSQTRSPNTLALALNHFVDENSPEQFLDQLPRWLLFGAPSRLCHSLAAARVELEERLKKLPLDEKVASGLKVVNQVYEAADNNPASILTHLLQEAYLAEIARPRSV